MHRAETHCSWQMLRPYMYIYIYWKALLLRVIPFEFWSKPRKEEWLSINSKEWPHMSSITFTVGKVTEITNGVYLWNQFGVGFFARSGTVFFCFFLKNKEEYSWLTVVQVEDWWSILDLSYFGLILLECDWLLDFGMRVENWHCWPRFGGPGYKRSTFRPDCGEDWFGVVHVVIVVPYWRVLGSSRLLGVGRGRSWVLVFVTWCRPESCSW